ncbi:MAG: hypothetical protein U5N55_12725 [Cypionkella sp.]|nr:hypothetical protein [Cypionkella sp.]
MSATNAFETALLQHIFQNADIALIGDATGLRGSVAAGSLFVSLHTADPGEAGTQATSETAYTGYARAAVARSGAGWTVAAANVSNAAVVSFGPCTAGTSTITHFGIGTAASGAGSLLFKGALVSSIAVTTTSNATQSFAIGQIDVDVE